MPQVAALRAGGGVVSEDELKAIEAHLEAVKGRDICASAWERLDNVCADTRLLVAEVRRLRGLIKRLEWGSCDGCGIRRVCTECKAHNDDRDPDTWELVGKHKPDCPAFTPDGTVK